MILAFRREALGLAVADRVLMAGFVLVVGRRAVATLAGLTSILGPRLPSRPGVAFFVLPLLVYLASELSGEMTGKTFFVGGGRIAEMRVITHKGITKKTEEGLWTPDEIAAQMQEGEILLPT